MYVLFMRKRSAPARSQQLREPVGPAYDTEHKDAPGRAESAADADVWSCDSSKEAQQRRRDTEFAEVLGVRMCGFKNAFLQIQASRPVKPAVEAIWAASKPQDKTSTFKTGLAVCSVHVFWSMFLFLWFLSMFSVYP